jgi:hypothetical protein
LSLKVAGLPRIRPHDLRHTYASVLLKLRTPMKVVQDSLRHSSFAITADIYSHLAPDVQEQAAGLSRAALRRGSDARLAAKLASRRNSSERVDEGRADIHLSLWSEHLMTAGDCSSESSPTWLSLARCPCA